MEHLPIEHQILPVRCPSRPIDERDIARLLGDHARLRYVCEELGNLADRLADCPSLHERCAAANLLNTTMREHVKATSRFFSQAFEGEVLDYEDGILARILTRQITDCIDAEDMSEALQAPELDLVGASTLADMLRRVLESCRRALDFEELSLLSVGAERLTAAARTSLQQLLAQPQEAG